MGSPSSRDSAWIGSSCDLAPHRGLKPSKAKPGEAAPATILVACLSGSFFFSLLSIPPVGIISRLGDGSFGHIFILLIAFAYVKPMIAQTDIYRSLQLRAQNAPKVSKKSPRAFRLGVSKKSRRRSESLKKVSKKSLLDTSLRLVVSFRDFLDTPGRGACFWGVLGLEAPTLL